MNTRFAVFNEKTQGFLPLGTGSTLTEKRTVAQDVLVEAVAEAPELADYLKIVTVQLP